MRTTPFLFLLLSVAGCAFAQPAGVPLKFDAAIIRPGTAAPPHVGPLTGQFGCKGGPGTSEPTLLKCTIPVDDLISRAYKLKPYQFTPPDRMRSSWWEIEARVPAGATPDQIPAMEQDLLATRFKLAVHFVKKQAEIYEMTVGEGGPKFKEWADLTFPDTGERPQTLPSQASDIHPPPDATAGFVNVDGHHLFRAKQSMQQLAAYLTGNLGARPVIDATGLTGSYDIMLDYVAPPSLRASPLDASPASGPLAKGPTLLKAVDSQLGLRLEPKKGAIDVFVIDHIEKKPTRD